MFIKCNELQEHVCLLSYVFIIFFFFKVQDCHIIKYLPKEEYNGHSAALVVGGKNASPFYVRIPHDYRLFQDYLYLLASSMYIPLIH